MASKSIPDGKAEKLARYRAFLEAKCQLAPGIGFTVDPSAVNQILKPHQRDVVVWACGRGRAGLFEAFGLGKSVQQLEILRLTIAYIGMTEDRAFPSGLIVAPLGVRQEFKRDAAMLGLDITFVRRTEEVLALRAPTNDDESAEEWDARIHEPRLYITNYESVRDGRLDCNLFDAVSLDEASCLRGFGGTKTFREFMRIFEGNAKLRFRFVATATPSPNAYEELLAYSAFLEVMDIGQAKTRFFKRDATKADKLTLHPHKEREFWLWVNSWAVFLQKPSDLGYSDEGYSLPPLDIRWHELPTDHANAGHERDGQARLVKNAAIGVVDAAREKRDSLGARIAKLMEIRAEDPGAHRLIWHDLEPERKAIEAAIPECVSVYGTQDLDTREQAIIDFSDGRIQELAAKPVLAGSGCNFQRHCHWSIYLGIGFKFNDFIQSVHRTHRFLQEQQVRIDLVYTEAEREVRNVLIGKWERHNRMVARMSEIIREYQLNQAAMTASLARTIGAERREVKGEGYHLVSNDAVVEAIEHVADDSLGLIVTSIPFSTQYEYTPSYNDFGHTDDNGHFWRQMDFLSPELLRALQPGRVLAVHCKDRITPGGINGLGFQTVTRFSDEAAEHFERHGFAFLARKTIVTDVVRENNQTYRLGWTEQCKDGSRMGCGMPEYVLLFRKPPTDRSNGYADEPVRKERKLWRFDQWENEGGYSRARWQLDAHGFARSSGERLLSSDDLAGVAPDIVYKLFKRHSLTTVYDFEHHVELAEFLESRGSLPPTFMLLPPASWHPDVWADVARMVTLNSRQVQKGQEMHLCPLQFDIVDRLIDQFSMPGEVVGDPFGGIMTVPYRAILKKRKAWACELNPGYFRDGLGWVEAAVQKVSTPSLFDLLETEGAA